MNVEEQIKRFIGDLVVANMSLQSMMEELQKKNIELQSNLDSITKGNSKHTD